MKRLVKISLTSLLVLIFVLLICGTIYEQRGRLQDRKRLPQIGRSVDIGGRTLNISCKGTGQPAVIFESGGRGPGLEWDDIQAEVAKYTEACWYDRAGEGWSDAGPYPRTSRAIATDLHKLLQRAKVPSSYVLAGASFGGLNSRVYVGLYPAEVAGIVLIDSADEDELRLAPKFFLGHTAPRYLWHPLCFAFEAAAAVGVLRLMNPSLAKRQNVSPASDADEMIEKLRRQPRSIAMNVCTGVVLPESYREGSAVRNLGDVPLTVLTAGMPLDFGDPELNRQAAAYQQVWIHQIQYKLARLSTRGRQIVVEHSTHNIAHEAVTSAIRDLVFEIRRQETSH
jgi:pimeloyl-ACP methyl ester carboxylesterase